jgi:DHA1 family inner membrane transport protein
VPPRPLPWALIASGCLALFAISCSGNVRAPFIIDMSRDLASSIGLTANLMGMNAVTWGIASLVAGAWSDRIGRRPFLIGGPVALAVSMAGIAASDTYLGVAVWVAAAGAAAGSVSAVVVTEVSSRVEDSRRGRALGWTLAGQSLAMLLGVPLAAALGEVVGWRGVHVGVAAVTLASSLCLLVATRRPAGTPGSARRAGTSYRAALTPRVTRLLVMGVAERCCYALAVTFFATYLQASYGLPVSGLAIPLALFALGNILGTLLGGQLADRLPNRQATFAGAMICAAIVALPLFLWQGGLAVSALRDGLAERRAGRDPRHGARAQCHLRLRRLARRGCAGRAAPRGLRLLGLRADGGGICAGGRGARMGNAPGVMSSGL